MKKNQLKQVQNQAQAGYMQNNEPQIAGREAGKRNRIKTHSQSGRSMVEMLGVLAIIAILSIGGIVGFRLAMNYYQANQIAHEMNMMRTDAQIKIAQGTEKLTLGAPYDAHKINFNNYDTAFGCKYVDENDLISDETVSCQIANAYFIELPKIPNGVCQPLARLINGMDNLIAFYVNGPEYEEGGNCQEGENDLYAVFSGETVSDLTRCERDDDCKELESTPVCDTDRHVCVECTADDDCPYNTDYCEDNTCKTCDSGVWGGQNKGCVECTDNGDCADTPDTPVCNTETNTCVECLTYSDCTDTPETPQCDDESHTCKSCAEIDLSKPVWNGTQCVECPEDEPWNGESCGCKSNDDCETNEYCHIVWRVLDESGNITYMKDNGACGKGDTGICRSLGNYQSQNLGDDTYYISDINMVWWSAENYCQALGKIGKGSGKMVSWSKLDLKCANDIILQDGCKCGENGCSGGSCGSVIYKSGDGVYCLKNASLPQSQTNIPDKIIKIRDLFFNGQLKHVWLADVSSCFAKTFRTDGYIYMRARYFGYDSMSTDGYAFCY